VELVRSSKTCPGPLCDTMLASTAHVAPTTTIPLSCIFARLVVNLHIVRCRRRTTHFTSTITTLLLGVTDLVVVLRVTVWHQLTPSRVWPTISTPSLSIADALFVHPAGLRRQRKATNDTCIVTIGITHLIAAVSAFVGSWRTIVDIGVGVVVTAFLPALSPPTAYPITTMRLMDVNLVPPRRVHAGEEMGCLVRVNARRLGCDTVGVAGRPARRNHWHLIGGAMTWATLIAAAILRGTARGAVADDHVVVSAFSSGLRIESCQSATRERVGQWGEL